MQYRLSPSACLALGLIGNASCVNSQHKVGRDQPVMDWTLPERPTTARIAGELVPLELVGESPNSPLFQRHPGRRVVRDSASWHEVWRQTHSPVDSLPLPPIDFGNKMVIAATSGPFDVDGTFSIDSVVQANDHLYVIVSTKLGCGPTGTVMASGPTILLSVPAKRNVTFVERSTTKANCR